MNNYIGLLSIFDGTTLKSIQNKERLIINKNTLVLAVFGLNQLADNYCFVAYKKNFFLL